MGSNKWDSFRQEGGGGCEQQGESSLHEILDIVDNISSAEALQLDQLTKLPGDASRKSVNNELKEMLTKTFIKIFDFYFVEILLLVQHILILKENVNQQLTSLFQY